MAVKQGGKKTVSKAAPKAMLDNKKSGAEKARQKDLKEPIAMDDKVSGVSGWLQDMSLEVPVAAEGMAFGPGEREVEFSVAVRQRQEGDVVLAELRGRALVHAQGHVLALAEASYLAVKPADMESEALVKAMYVRLRPSLQQALAMAGHTPPLPDSLERPDAE